MTSYYNPGRGNLFRRAVALGMFAIEHKVGNVATQALTVAIKITGIYFGSDSKIESILMATTWRHSPLFQFKHGDHTCLFYRSEDALMEVLTPYVGEGILKGERCFCAQKPEILKRLIYDLRFLGLDTDKEIKRGALELHTENEAYFPNNRFEPLVMMEMLTRSIAETAEKGFTGFRSAGELSWAVQGRNECDQIIEYEQMVERAFPGRPAIGLCQYAVNAFTPEVLELVLETHRLHLSDTHEDCHHSSLHVQYGTHGAEIVANKLLIDPHYYYVVQQVLQREIIGWGVAPTFDGATTSAEQIVRDTVGRIQPIATA